ncbi:MAG: hypothetical protein QOJ94_2913 [Sphingomonadales bacterium]|jgi:hypothetical protein|nr:hypothetical protein [Sphingomonadales bacterium]
MIAFWLVLMFFGVAMLTYGLLIRPRPGDSKSE